ncbi:hypothetical protein [Vibrio splendidus]|uniref:hypothetical protein n=2 Tax=Vibrio TaxID=662 RepID=UPI000D367358|nr:hypothetical protein [Vibrio splendidus]PTO84111.1 hypothetical protein CWO29_21360 [Vibrio splendidus]
MLSYGMTQAVAKASTERVGVTRYATKLEASAGLNESGALTPSSMYSVFRDAMAFYKDVHYSVFASSSNGQSVSITLPNDVFSAEFCVSWSGDDAVTATVHVYQEDGLTVEQSEIELRNGEPVTCNLGRQAESITMSLPPTPNSESGFFKVSNAMAYRGYRKTLEDDAQLFVLTGGLNGSAIGYQSGAFGNLTPTVTIEGYECVRLTALSGVVRLSFSGDVSLNGRTVVMWVNGISCDFVLSIQGSLYTAMTTDPNVYSIVRGSLSEELNIQLLFL